MVNSPALDWLDLQNNRVTWDAWAQSTLERMPNLRVLDLSDNPLLQAPDLSRMRRLGSLFISNASLTQLPAGLARIDAPLVIDLSNNQFTALPENFAVPAHIGQVMALESTMLSPLAQLQIDAYYEAHGIDLMVADSDYSELLGDSTISQQQIWNRLPLQYRRDLRQILDLDTFLDNEQQALAELWQRLTLMDVNAGFRQRALARPAVELFELML
ncbi:Leucine Rich Repeat protein [compost metagenome]